MDLRRFELAIAERRARATIYEATGELELVLDGERVDPAIESARPLCEAIAAGGRQLPIWLHVDAVARTARARFADGSEAAIGYEGIAAPLTAIANALFQAARPRQAPEGSPDEAAFWEVLYREGRDRWELGRAAPPLARWVAFHADTVSRRKTLVVGCGRGHEARLLARAGAEVIAIDLARDAVNEARAIAAREEVSVDFRERDLFRMREEPERFDLVVEHCCFCAIDPERRREYVETVTELLRDGGELVGLFWAHGRPGGPPFTVTRAELGEFFGDRFSVEEEEIPADSVAARGGQEILIRFRRR